MKDNYTLGILPNHIDNKFQTYNHMSKNFDIIEKSVKPLLFDFSGTYFIKGNMVVYLDIIKRYHEKYLGSSHSINYKDYIKDLLKRNRYIKEEFEVDDPQKTTVAFSRHFFQYQDEDEFARYIYMELLSHYRFDKVSLGLKYKLLESILELYANIKQHTDSSFITTCGQFFPETKLFILSIGNIGGTFRDSISKKIIISEDREYIEWALLKSNTSKESLGGMGLYTLHEFINLINGKFQIISGKGFYENNFKENRIISKELKYRMPGTVVTLFIDLTENIIYNKDDIDNL